jgi:hypothetical protein
MKMRHSLTGRPTNITSEDLTDTAVDESLAEPKSVPQAVELVMDSYKKIETKGCV